MVARCRTHANRSPRCAGIPPRRHPRHIKRRQTFAFHAQLLLGTTTQKSSSIDRARTNGSRPLSHRPSRYQNAPAQAQEAKQIPPAAKREGASREDAALSGGEGVPNESSRGQGRRRSGRQSQRRRGPSPATKRPQAAAEKSPASPAKMSGVPSENRTHLPSLKGWCPNR